MKNNQEINETCIDKVQEFCQISDTDREVMTYVFPHTMRAIDDVKRIHPEAVIKLVVVVGRSNSADNEYTMDHYADVHNAISAAYDAEIETFHNMMALHADYTYTNCRSLPTVIKLTASDIDSAVFIAVIDDRICPAFITLTTDNIDGVTMYDEICIGAFVEDRLMNIHKVEDGEFEQITKNDIRIATKLYKTISNASTPWMTNIKKKNMAQIDIVNMIECGRLTTHDNRLPQSLFDNPRITMSDLSDKLDDIDGHFDAIILGGNDGIDPEDFKVDMAFGHRLYMSRQFIDAAEPLMINHLLMRGDVAAIAFLYKVYDGNEEMRKHLKTGVVFNCDHPDIANAIAMVAGVWDRVEDPIDAQLDEFSNGDNTWHLGWDYPYECRLWDYLLEKEKINPSCNVIPITTEIIDGYVKYAVNDALESLSKYAEERKKAEGKTE